ncbi:MAG: CBS domain-containing protein, partial [Candidatus Bathyarchaeota archaeon]
AKNLSPNEIEVVKIMSKPLITASPKLSAMSAAQEMVDKNVRRLVIVQGNKMKGVVTYYNIAKNLNDMTQTYCAAILGKAGKGSLMG